MMEEMLIMEHFRNEYKGDSVLLYYKPLSTPEEISARYNLSSTFKNPFLIAHCSSTGDAGS